ncbi:hypothetical protein EBR57_10960 [bacterium]|nr:hypothetical protein [bacterium]
MSYIKSDEFLNICSKFQGNYQFSNEELDTDILHLDEATKNTTDFYDLSMINFVIGLLYGELAKQRASN